MEIITGNVLCVHTAKSIFKISSSNARARGEWNPRFKAHPNQLEVLQTESDIKQTKRI